MGNEIPTWAEVNFWVAFAIIAVIAFGILWFKSKRESANYVEWIERGEW